MQETDRSPLPRVRDVLELPELRAGSPVLLAGEAGVDREVRWAHVVAGAGAAALLDGGELVLSTGAGWPSDPAALSAFAEQLTTAGGGGVAAIVLEFGHGFTEAPAELIRACAVHGVPLVALRDEVRFVQITQRVHQRILAAQTEALEAREAVHAMLTELGLNRSPVDYVVERLADTLGAPVVLEDSAYRVVAFAASGGDVAEALAPWGRIGAPLLPAAAERVPVEARGQRWGHLTVLPGPAHPAGRRTVLELGAFALALGRLADAGGDDWLQLGSKRMFDALLNGRYRSDTELAAQLAAAGLPIEGRVAIAATLRGTGDSGSHASLERAILETALRRAVAPDGRVLVTAEEPARAADPGDSRAGAGASVAGAASVATEPADGPVLLALISLPAGDARIPSAADRGAPALAALVARELDMLVPEPTPSGWRAHLALGRPARRLRGLVTALEQLRAAGRLHAVAEVGRVAVQLAEGQPLAHLVRGLSALPELQEFALDTLGPVIEHDRAAGPARPGDLLRVLEAYVAHPANRSLAAQRARLSRSVFYQRLSLIEDLLGVDLADGETTAAIAVALLVRPA